MPAARSIRARRPRRALRFAAPLAIAASLVFAGCSESNHASLPLTHPYDPLTTAQHCLTREHIATTASGVRRLLIGSGVQAPSIMFATTFDEAEGIEVRGGAEGAERIGSAFLFVGGASDSLLKKIETCLEKQDTSVNRSA
jgi:hypothetical protein